MTGIVHVLGKEKIKSVACHVHECPQPPSMRTSAGEEEG